MTSDNVTGSGSWLYTMSSLLVERNIKLYNIVCSSSIKNIIPSCSNGIVEWIVPDNGKRREGLPSSNTIQSIQKLVAEIQPDILHIWGMEGCYAMMAAKGLFEFPVLLDIQGLLFTCAESFYGDLSFCERLSCIGIREAIRISSMPMFRYIYLRRRGEEEKYILSHIKNISTQSDWVRSNIAPYISNKSKIYSTKIIVRNEFLIDKPISPMYNHSLSIIFNPAIFKGFDVILKALNIVRSHYPDVILKVIGNFENNLPFYKKQGYIKFCEKLITKYRLANNILFAGKQDAKGMVEIICSTDIFIQPSFVESYSLALAEAMRLGKPSVVAYAGAMPELASNNNNAIFYSPKDYRSCANAILKLFGSRVLCDRFSKNAFEIARERENTTDVVETQLSIYRDILSKIG